MSEEKEKVLVWDVFVRSFHWALVALVLLAFASGDDANWLHYYAGYAILVLIGLRLIWGVIGGRYARFTSFVTTPGEALQYLKRMSLGRAEYHLGHNPAAGWMILALLVVLLLVNGSGYLALSTKQAGVAASGSSLNLVAVAHADDDRGEGSDADGGIWKDLHEGVAGFLLFLVALHVLGALVSSVLHRENLVRSMIDGKKTPRD